MRILVIAHEPPWPLCYGGRLRSFELCQRLAHRHELILLASRAGDVESAPFDFECRVMDDRDDQNTAGVPDGDVRALGRTERYFGMNLRFIQSAIGFARDWKPDVVLGLNYKSLSCLSRMTQWPTVCDLVDDEALHNLLEFWRGKAKSRWSMLKDTLVAWAHQRLLLPKVDAVTVTSAQDQRFCAWTCGHPLIEVVPNGVDCDFYSPGSDAVNPHEIIFWGSLEFGPNISAILYFANHIWEAVRAQIPDATWTILGRGESSLLHSIRELEGVNFRGFVEDIRPHVSRAAVAILPMCSGAGIKNKLMEAWAMGKPVVCTQRAVGSLPATDGKNICLARSTEEMISKLVDVLHDVRRQRELSEAGRLTALEQCSWDEAARKLERTCVDVLLARRPIRYDVEINSDREAMESADATDQVTVNNEASH